MIKCGNCKEYHVSTDAVRECYEMRNAQSTVVVTVKEPDEPPASEKQVAFIRSLLEEKAWEANLNEAGVKMACDFLDGKSTTKRNASALIEALLPLKRKADPNKAKWPSVPAGKYALLGEDGTVKFYKVDRPAEGRWAGYIFVHLLVGSPGNWSELRARADAIMPRIEAMGAVESARLFGYKARSCGQCGSPLSNLRSRAAGYGQVCADKVGWPYPSEREARRILHEMGEQSDTPEWTLA